MKQNLHTGEKTHIEHFRIYTIDNGAPPCPFSLYAFDSYLGFGAGGGKPPDGAAVVDVGGGPLTLYALRFSSCANSRMGVSHVGGDCAGAPLPPGA